MKKLIIKKLVLIMLIIGFLLTLIETYNFRNYGISTAIDKAQSISEVVKNGLTAHMVNGNMHQRDVFLESISNMDNIEKLWVIRGEKVTSQYGHAKKNEKARDEIDLNVLKSSKLEYKLNESLLKSSIRVTIPYVAERTELINCTDCHNVNYGDTLGAVSIVLDISDIKTSGLSFATSILIFTFIAVISIIFFANRILKPHLNTIIELSDKIKDISNGVFTNIVSSDNLSYESRKLVNEYNALVNGLSTTFSDIDDKLNIFIGNQTYGTTNPLLNAQKVIGNLSEIYQFKKEIEVDETKGEIYARIAQILKNKFNLNQFSFMEQNFENEKTAIVFDTGETNSCAHALYESPNLCRVSRSVNDVKTVKDHHACPYFKNENKLYYCISIDIADHTKLVINFVLDNEIELNNLKTNIPLIKKYILEAAPSVMVKLLLEELKVSAFKDGLTGLYNRKFLDEHLNKLVPQALREEINIGVLMLDMDHFKSVNDEYGHDVGDIVLKELSKILNENVRESDIVVRYGGEEFVVLLVGIDGEQSAINIANKLREKVSQNEINIYAGNKLKKTISVGLSMFPGDSNNFNLVMKNADIALYDAKAAGRNQVIRYKEKVEVELF
jgi:diguanylate cyclase (GGDEF)-like protein